jgi:hypothetical protein
MGKGKIKQKQNSILKSFFFLFFHLCFFLKNVVNLPRAVDALGVGAPRGVHLLHVDGAGASEHIFARVQRAARHPATSQGDAARGRYRSCAPRQRPQHNLREIKRADKIKKVSQGGKKRERTQRESMQGLAGQQAEVTG